MKSVIAASLIASAAAFAPAAKQATSVALQAADDIGATAPLGVYDPLKLLTGDEERANKLRDYEIRHGRCAMLAVTGWLTTASGARFPGMEGGGFGLKAFTEFDGLSDAAKGVYPLTLFTIASLSVVMADFTGGEFIGDWRNEFLDFGWDQFDEQTKLRKRSIELNNGRAAMMGITGIVTHELLGNLNELGLPQP